jgi:uncharacterized membrane protein
MPTLRYNRDTAEFDRGIQFFDAIYGFAITLLITTVHLPSASAWSSIHALLRSGLMSQLLGFVLSFTVIALFWRANYRLIASLKAMDPTIVLTNIVCAFFIVLITFSTQALNAPHTSNLPLPVALYAVNIALASLSQTVMYDLAERRGLTKIDRPPALRQRVRLMVPDLVFPAVFLASVPIAYVISTSTAQYSWASLLLLSPLARRLTTRRGPQLPVDHPVIPAMTAVAGG